MKKILGIAFFILFVFCSFVFANNFPSSSMIDPNSFYKKPVWKIVEKTFARVTPRLVTFIIQNPDRKAEVQRVRVWVLMPSGVVLCYQYFYNGDIDQYIMESRGFVRRELSLHQRRSCIPCHNLKSKYKIPRSPKRNI